jgi:ribosomal protein S27AE
LRERRKRRRKEKPEVQAKPFDQLCPNCRDFMIQWTWKDRVEYDCGRCGTMSEQQAKGTYRLVTTGLGKCWVVTTLRCVDDYPALLASELAIFLDVEMPLLRAALPDERARLWTRRVGALASERELRAAEPTRTAYGADA